MFPEQREHVLQQQKLTTQPSKRSPLERLRGYGHARARSGYSGNELRTRRGNAAWYWRLVAIKAAFMILGGFLMLPATFDNDPQMRISQAVVGIFAAALVVAGFSITVLLCFAVPDQHFHADNVFLPAFTSCALGLLTVLYDFVVYSRYHWNTPALLATLGAAVSTIVYGGLLLWSQRKITATNAKSHHELPVQMTRMSSESQTALAQEQTFYQNYNRNMFPTAYTRKEPAIAPQAVSAPDAISEDELTRQQMLMLLLNRDSPSISNPSSSTFRIDWQGRDEDDTPVGGWYARQPGASSAYSPSAYPTPGISRRPTEELRPWDGVWREVRQPPSQEFRDARRREIEGGTLRT